MGFSFLSELEKRFDVQLYRLGWFPTIASARQAIQHKHVGLWTVKDRKNTDSASLPASPGIQIRNSALNYELNKGDIFFFRDKKSTKKTDLLVNHWLQSKLSFTNFYKFPWEIFSSAIKEEVSPVQESGDKMSCCKQGPVWLLGNHQSSIQLSSTIVEKTLHSTNETIFSSTAFLTEPSVGNENQFYISGNENTCFANKLAVSSPVASIGTDQIFTGLHLSTSPLWNWSAPNHLEYHCQSFFALYKEHPSWMNTKIPETKDRMQNFKNYMSSHV